MHTFVFNVLAVSHFVSVPTGFHTELFNSLKYLIYFLYKANPMLSGRLHMLLHVALIISD